MNLEEIRNSYLAEGFSYIDAGSRTCQDVILTLIGRSPLLKNVTIKGGVVMQHLSGDSRRATQDFDLDFIRYSLSDESIKSFVDKLSEQSDDISISITAPLEDLKHQDYKGKRAYITIADNTGIKIDTKLDIGVHKNLNMEQDSYCFDLSKLDDSVTLLINTKEQILVEKLKSLLKFGILSTRYKDIFDMYWLAIYGNLNKEIIMTDIALIVYNDRTMSFKKTAEILSRLETVLNDTKFLNQIAKYKRHNWLDIAPEQVAKDLLNSFRELFKNH